MKTISVVLSIKPEFVYEIFVGKKRYEFRKAILKHPMDKVYIYASAPISKVVGEFEPVGVLEGSPETIWRITREFAVDGDKRGAF